LLRHRGLALVTVARHEWLIMQMLPALGSNTAQYSAASVRSVILDQIRGRRPADAKTFVGALRIYLRFLAVNNACQPGLDDMLPTVAEWRLSSLPRYLDTTQANRLIDTCGKDGPQGLRDRAIILLLLRLGLRAGEAARLGLDDIDWTNGVLRVAGKGREHLLPIPVDVGEALTAWLRRRPLALDRAVFIRMHAPRQMMTVSGLSGIIARLSDQAGIAPIRAHRLRHTAAMDVLAAGGTLTEAKELLGHAYAVTTMTYAKVDLTSLRQLVVPFGQVPR